MMKNKYSDAEMLRNMLLRLKKKEKLRNLAVKCFIFNDDPVLFELLLGYDKRGLAAWSIWI